MNEFRFYDTSSLLICAGLLPKGAKFALSSVTLKELENIKSSSTVDSDLKYSARVLLRYLAENYSSLDLVQFAPDMMNLLGDADSIVWNNDTRILACALWYDRNRHPDETIFVTNDLALRLFANQYFGEDCIESVNEDLSDTYTGFKEIMLYGEEMASFYSDLNNNYLDLEIGEYAIIHDEEGEIVDTRCWTGETYRPLRYDTFSSAHFGNVKPLKNDVYQRCLADSFSNNKITLVKGPAGSGKTYLSLGYLLHLLDRGRIDKIIVFCNTVATKNSARLGSILG